MINITRCNNNNNNEALSNIPLPSVRKFPQKLHFPCETETDSNITTSEVFNLTESIMKKIEKSVDSIVIEQVFLVCINTLVG